MPPHINAGSPAKSDETKTSKSIFPVFEVFVFKAYPAFLEVEPCADVETTAIENV
jgi:hypothetical protein